MNITEPFGFDYTVSIPKYKIEIAFKTKGECGMGGPTYGTLNISGMPPIQRSLRCMRTTEDDDLLCFFAWDSSDGVTKTLVYILDFVNKEIKYLKTEYGAYEIHTFTKNEIILVNYRGEKIKFSIHSDQWLPIEVTM